MRTLILCLDNWNGPAKLPYALKRVGFTVGMLCHPKHFAANTRCVDQYYFTDLSSRNSILKDVVMAIEAFKPVRIIPGMELAVRVLMELLSLKDENRLPSLSDEMAEVIRRSIFVPSRRKYFDSKIDLTQALQDRGVRVPPLRECHTLGDVDAFLQEHGFPVIIKPDQGYAGTGIAICYTEDELFDALRTRLTGKDGRWMIQKFLECDTSMYQMFAHEGKIVCGYPLFRVMTNPRTGPSTVVQLIENDEMKEIASQVADLLNYNGLGSIQCLFDREKDQVYFMEANMRIGATMHLGRFFGIDLSRAIFELDSDVPISSPVPNIGITVALYPEEAIRDPQSPHLQGNVDYPIDDEQLRETYDKYLEKELAKKLVKA